ncbi:dioxygenase family protein [Streptomyces sp. NPDC000994]
MRTGACTHRRRGGRVPDGREHVGQRSDAGGHVGQGLRRPGEGRRLPLVPYRPRVSAECTAISNPGVLPMAPDAPGETLIVSGVVRSTSGEPLAGAVVDLWQTDTEGLYSGITAGQVGPLPIVNPHLSKYHLRGKIVTDAEGRYECRTVVPGLESLTVPGAVFDELLHKLGKANSRARHIHANVTH